MAPVSKKTFVRKLSVFLMLATMLIVCVTAVYAVTETQRQQETARIHDEGYVHEQDILNDVRFYDGITINGIAVGGMTKDQALAYLDLSNRAKVDTLKLSVVYGDKTWEFDADDMPITFDNGSIIEQAYAIGRVGTREQRMAEINAVRQNGLEFSVSYAIDDSGIPSQLRTLAQEIAYPAKDAMITQFDPDAVEIADKFQFGEPVSGLEVDVEKLVADAIAEIKNETFGTVTVATAEIHSQVTVEMLRANITLIGQCSTTTTSVATRNQNIRLASNSFHGKVLLPGEVFSINNSTGPRTPEKGYQPAGAIVNGVMSTEVGGGVCQVSGTLYNAVLGANLQIVERSHHTWPSDYLPMGLDATINYGSADFRFKNNKTAPIFLAVSFKNNRLSIYVYGPADPDGYTYKPRSVYISSIAPGATAYTLNSSMEPGTTKVTIKPRTGHVVESYLDVFDRENKLVRSTLIVKDTYRAIAGKGEKGPDLPSVVTP